MKSYTISVSRGPVAEAHDKRENLSDFANIDSNRICLNKTIIASNNYKNDFNEFFNEAVEEYNAKQTRRDRRIKDYYEHVKNTKVGGKSKNKMKPIYECVLQIGNRETNSVLSEDDDTKKLKKILDEYCATLQDRFPNLKFWFIGSHDDEPDGTYHYHLAFTPWVENSGKGLSKKVGLNAALESMGISNAGCYDEWDTVDEETGKTQHHKRRKSLFEMFTEKMKSDVEIMMLEHGYEREYKNSHLKGHKSKDEYIIDQKLKQLEEISIEQQELELELANKAVELANKSVELDEREKVLQEQENALNRKYEVFNDDKRKYENDYDAKVNKLELEKRTYRIKRNLCDAILTEYKQNDFVDVLNQSKKVCDAYSDLCEYAKTLKSVPSATPKQEDAIKTIRVQYSLKNKGAVEKALRSANILSSNIKRLQYLENDEFDDLID